MHEVARFAPSRNLLRLVGDPPSTGRRSRVAVEAIRRLLGLEVGEIAADRDDSRTHATSKLTSRASSHLTCPSPSRGTLVARATALLHERR